MKTPEDHKCTIGQVEKVHVIHAPDTKKTGTINTICPGCKLHKDEVVPVDWGITLNRLGRISGCAVNQLSTSD